MLAPGGRKESSQWENKRQREDSYSINNSSYALPVRPSLTGLKLPTRAEVHLAEQTDTVHEK